MSKVIHVKKGLTINIAGKPERIFHQLPLPEKVALKPTDFVGLVPKLLVQEGDVVKAGDPLFCDKKNESIVFTSPVSGTVNAVFRGERRKLLQVEVLTDTEITYKKFDIPEVESLQKEDITKLLLSSGLWPYIKQRPYACIANPADMPKAIFISAFDTAPLAPDYTFLIGEYKDDFLNGVSVLKKLTSGKTHIGLYDETRANNPFVGAQGLEFHYFDGPHPVGNVGVQIHHIDPINKGDIVWTLNPQDVVIIGRFFRKKIYDAKKIVACSGSVKKAYYYKTIANAVISSVLQNCDLPKDSRIISGNVLTGTQVEKSGYLGFYDSHITIIPENKNPEFLGWLMPGLEKYSVSRTFLSWLKPDKTYTINTKINGGERPFVFTGQYEKVLPMDIYPIPLLKAIITQDIDKIEQLGIYEVAEEDFALCEFICPSKIEIQSIIREGLDMIKKEFN